MIMNLTPHSLNLPGGTVPPSGTVARVATIEYEVGTGPLGSVLISQSFGEVTDLPAARDGVLYVVSALVRAACLARTDLASPARLVRDAAGRVTGCKALAVTEAE